MTGKSASVFGLEERGVIKVGNYADLVIFNPETLMTKRHMKLQNYIQMVLNMFLLMGN